MYSLFMLFAALAVGAQVRRSAAARRSTGCCTASATAAMLWTQYFAVLPVLVQQVGVRLGRCWRDRRDRHAPAALLRGWALSPR